jgi:hypothetical protein
VSVEHLTRMDDEELGRSLRALEPMLLVPHAPDVTDAVSEAIRAGRRPRRSVASGVRLAILVAAALLLLATAAAAARWVIDLGGITIEPPPTTSPSVSRPPLTGPAFGEPMRLRKAETDAGFRAIVPSELGEPDRVWLASGDEPDSVAIAMAWYPRPGLPRIPGTPYGASLIEVTGSADLVAKRVDVRFVELTGPDTFWIHTEHEVELLTGGETRVFVVTGNVLVWQDGMLALRLETDLPKADALAIADLPR